MSIYLITGLPGAAKTLYTLFTVENRRIADNKRFKKEWVEAGSDEENPPLVRVVYYFNIRIYRHMLPHWVKMDKPEEWLSKPNGSLFIFDECQEAFEPLNNAEKRPEYYKELSKHRHRGHDMYFMTQHPTYVDTYVRKNTEEHSHLMRPWYALRATVHTWKGVRDNCDKTRKDSLSSTFKHPKHVYKWYRSAQYHTNKLKVPAKIMALLLIPVFILGSAFVAWRYFDQKKTPATELAAKDKIADTNKTQMGQPASAGGIASIQFNPADWKPRIDDLPWTSPRYDHLTEATVAPRIMGCMVYQQKCKCMTQQGTYHIATMQFCNVVLENGLFQDFEDGGGAAKPDKDSQQVKVQLPKVEPTPSNEKSRIADSGFNLPISKDRYALKTETAPSGQMYVKGLPDSKVLLGNH